MAQDPTKCRRLQMRAISTLHDRRCLAIFTSPLRKTGFPGLWRHRDEDDPVPLEEKTKPKPEKMYASSFKNFANDLGRDKIV